MVKNRIKTLKAGISVVFAVLALALVLGSPASVLAAQGWYDSQAWFNRGGPLPDQTDWYNAIYGSSVAGQPSAYSYYENQIPSQKQEESWKGPATQQYYGNYPTQPGFTKFNKPSSQGQETPGSLSKLYREEPYAPPATPDYYGSFPTEPGFSKFAPVEGSQPYAYYGYQQEPAYRYYTPDYYSEAQPGAGAAYQEQYGQPSTHYYYGNNSTARKESMTSHQPRSYQDQETPGSLSKLYREEPYAPPATPDYYGSFPTEPGFSKFRPQEVAPQD